MGSLLPLSVILIMASLGTAPLSVHAATCSSLTNMACVETDFTLATCNPDTKICDCKAGYLPIPTGCAARLRQPTVTVEKGSIKEAVAGSTFHLNCSSDAPPMVTYEWKNGREIMDCTAYICLLTAGEAGNSDSFTCKAKYPGLDSPESAEITITYVGAVAQSQSTPEVDAKSLPKKAALGVSLNPKCSNIPMGAVYKFGFDTSETTPPEAAPFDFSGDPDKNQTRCEVEGDFMVNKYSNMVNLPEVTDDIEKVTVDHTGLIYNNFHPESPPVMICYTIPEEIYLEKDGRTILYTFDDSVLDKPLPPSANSTYAVIQVANKPVHHVTCEASYNNQSWKKSNVYDTVVISDGFIKTNTTLIANASQVDEGSRLVLTCGVPADSLTYTWTKNGVPIPFQKDRILQINGFQETDSGNYSCTITKMNFHTRSSLFISLASASSTVLASTIMVFIAAILSRLF